VADEPDLDSIGEGGKGGGREGGREGGRDVVLLFICNKNSTLMIQ